MSTNQALRFLALVVLLCLSGVQISHCRTDPSPQPSPRAGHGLAMGMVWVGRLYVVGGCTQIANTTSVWALLTHCAEVNGEVWAMLWEEHSGNINWFKQWPPAAASSPSAYIGDDASQALRYGASVVSFFLPGTGSGVTTLFIWAGAGGGGQTRSDGWLYDTERDAWTNLTTNPDIAGRALHSTNLYKNLTIMFGGASVDETGKISVFSDIVVYDLMNSSWSVARPTPSPPGRAFHSASLLSGFPQTLFVYGGVDGNGRVLSDLWLAHWIGDHGGDLSGTVRWTPISPVGVTPPPLFGHILRGVHEQHRPDPVLGLHRRRPVSME